MSGETEGRTKCAQNFVEHNFLPCRLTEVEFASITGNYIPPEFVARNPGSEDSVNFLPEGELVIPLEHFEVGFRLPLWPEVRQALRYYGVVPDQLNPNSFALLVAFACYMRAERIELNLSIFRKRFNFWAKSGIVFFSGQTINTIGLANKNHNWAQKFVFVSGNFGNIPLSLVQYDEATYRPPTLGGCETAILSFFGTKNFDVKFLRRNLDSLPPVPAGEGEREIPLHQPFDEVRGSAATLALAKSAALACRDESGSSSQPSSQKRKPDAPSSSPSKKSKPSATDKGKSVAETLVEAPPAAGIGRLPLGWRVAESLPSDDCIYLCCARALGDIGNISMNRIELGRATWACATLGDYKLLGKSCSEGHLVAQPALAADGDRLGLSNLTRSQVSFPASSSSSPRPERRVMGLFEAIVRELGLWASTIRALQERRLAAVYRTTSSGFRAFIHSVVLCVVLLARRPDFP
ncbi:hypothetical protein KSP39_PZI015271 [Platanthera zijinensis]|uniref:Transposase (putative) gypsy type domain-containing protein n=1 Tax=Platanthera zijinensis TaxID=2320716 RepID=A0AAP0B855_9ASPA